MKMHMSAVEVPILEDAGHAADINGRTILVVPIDRSEAERPNLAPMALAPDVQQHVLGRLDCARDCCEC